MSLNGLNLFSATAHPMVQQLSCAMRIGILVCLFGSLSAHNSLGPGPNLDWPVTPAEQVRLSSAALREASLAVQQVGTHLCLSVVKDGALIVDDYYDGAFMKGRERPVEGMSAAKAITAAVMGTAVQQGLFDIDLPIANYGVQPSPGANWSRAGPNYFPNVTARHLLSQTSGVGLWEPGTAFTYDSDEYIQHLSYLLTATAGNNMSAREWATQHFAKPLGIPDLYRFEGPDPAGRGDTPLANEGGQGAISAGGDQPLLCRDLARVGLLLANGGKWSNADGTSTQLVDPDFVEQMFTPQSTHIAPDVGIDPGHMTAQYSFLAEIATDNSPLVNKSACDATNGGEVRVVGLADRALVALGLVGKYLIVVPEENLVVVAFGNNLGRLECDQGTQGTWTNEESVILSAIWKALGPALSNVSALPVDPQLPKVAPDHNVRETRETARSFEHAEGADSHGVAMPGVQTGKGSCYCYCGYSQAIGQCFNHTTSAQECELMKNSSQTTETIGGFCSAASLVLDCFNKTATVAECPTSIGMEGYELDSDRPPTNCSTHASPSGPLMQNMACHYKPVIFDACFWTPDDVCVDSPYFPLL